MIPDRNFATCAIFACAATGNHWEMREKVVHVCVAFDACVNPSASTENTKCNTLRYC